MNRFLILAFALVANMVCANTAWAATYYVSLQGSDSGDGSSGAPFRTMMRAYEKMAGGDTLIVKNGIYPREEFYSKAAYPPSGSAAAWTRIMAETPLGVVMDGEREVNPFGNFNREGAGGQIEFVEFNGFVFRNQPYGALLYGVKRVKIRNCGFEDAEEESAPLFLTNVSEVLVEDSFAWGSGRYKFVVYESERVVFRRVLARFDWAKANGEPMAAFSFYTVDGFEAQNLISIDGDHPEFWTSSSESQYGGSYYLPTTAGPSHNVRIRGSIALNVAMQFGGSADQLDGIEISNCAGVHIQEGGNLRGPVTYTNNTFYDVYGPAIVTPAVGFNFYPGDSADQFPGAPTATNSIFAKIKGTALNRFDAEDNNLFWQNDLDRDTGTPTGAASETGDPSLVYLTQGVGGRGATILKRIGRDGANWGEEGFDEQTDVDLWPWPNEALIAQYLASYRHQDGDRVLEGKRGFAVDGESLTHYIWSYLGGQSPYTPSGAVDPGVIVPSPPPPASSPAPSTQAPSESEAPSESTDAQEPATSPTGGPAPRPAPRPLPNPVTPPGASSGIDSDSPATPSGNDEGDAGSEVAALRSGDDSSGCGCSVPRLGSSRDYWPLVVPFAWMLRRRAAQKSRVK
jgi:hypothetical protein